MNPGFTKPAAWTTIRLADPQLTDQVCTNQAANGAQRMNFDISLTVLRSTEAEHVDEDLVEVCNLQPSFKVSPSTGGLQSFRRPLESANAVPELDCPSFVGSARFRLYLWSEHLLLSRQGR
ncbi:unnamed protein product, partial [Cuscuta europaea]